MNAFGVHGCSVVTALTAQNTLGVQSVEPVSGSMLRNQLETLQADLPPAVIKTGMLGSADSCSIIADFISLLPAPRPKLICDPVLKSTSGSDLLEPEALDILKQHIFPNVTVLTPNLEEAMRLTGNAGPIEDTADQLLSMGVHSVLIKGGHAEGNECRDFWTDGKHSVWLSSPRIETRHTHGTGCILSSAIASAVALGLDIPEAIVTAKAFLNQCLKSPANVGAGHGPMQIDPFRNDPCDRPEVVAGIADRNSGKPGSTIPATTPTPATKQHSHLRRLSKIFPDDPSYFITTTTKDRLKVLDNPAVHQILRDEWDIALERHSWAIGSYVVMPDHVHFFCKPVHNEKRLSEFMQQWKQWTSKRIKTELKLDHPVWQPEFFDHVLRSHESYSEKWNYVEQNPVRAGLVENANDWPYAGSIHYK